MKFWRIFYGSAAFVAMVHGVNMAFKGASFSTEGTSIGWYWPITVGVWAGMALFETYRQQGQ